MQPLDVWYAAGYAQDEWRPRSNVTVTAGVRFDVASFKNTAFPNPAADALTFRDETGSPVQFQTGVMPDTKILWSPRVGLNWDVAGDQRTQVRGGTGIFSGKPAYVWISNQIGNTGVLIAETRNRAPGSSFPFNPDPDRYKAAPTGAPRASYTLNVTDPDFKFPQVWRSNVAVDQRCPAASSARPSTCTRRTSTASTTSTRTCRRRRRAFTGVDARPRWTEQPPQYRRRERRQQRLRAEERQRRQFVELSRSRCRATSASGSACAAPTATASRTRWSIRSRRRRRHSRESRTHGDPNNAGVQHFDVVAGTPRVRAGELHHAITSTSARPAISAFWEARPSTQHPRRRGSATCSPPT